MICNVQCRVRTAWKDMTPENKDAIWKYFTLLVPTTAVPRLHVELMGRYCLTVDEGGSR